jgi:hypothetical protein
VTLVAGKVFDTEPWIDGGGSGKIRLAYRLSSTMMELDDSDANKIKNSNMGSSSIGYADFDKDSTEIKWDFIDAFGREVKCKTTTKDELGRAVGGCPMNLCSKYFKKDGWCDKGCLSDACGYDTEDCDETDVMAKIDCDIENIGDGFCHQNCNN